MSHAHDHGTATRRRLVVALCVIVVVLVAELVGAWISGSLALLADAGHMAGDAIGLVVAVVASFVAARPATDRHTFGFRRVEVLSALLSGVLLTLVAVVVIIEAIRRFTRIEEVHLEPVPMLVVAALGLAANIAAFLVLRGGDRTSLNLRAALLDVFGDMVGSITAIAAAVILLLTGFVPVDAIASLLIAALILPRAYLLLRDVVRVLTESAPRETDVASIRSHILETPGVVDVHDVHVWAITSGSPVFSAHVECEPGIFERGETGAMLDRLGDCLRGHFDVEHSTFQLEPAGHAESEEPSHR